MFQKQLCHAESSLNQDVNRIYCNVTERSRSSTVPIKAKLVSRCGEQFSCWQSPSDINKGVCCRIQDVHTSVMFKQNCCNGMILGNQLNLNKPRAITVGARICIIIFVVVVSQFRVRCLVSRLHQCPLSVTSFVLVIFICISQVLCSRVIYLVSCLVCGTYRNISCFEFHFFVFWFGHIRLVSVLVYFALSFSSTFTHTLFVILCSFACYFQLPCSTMSLVKLLNFL